MVEILKHVKSSLFLMIVTVLLVSTFVPLTNPMTNNELVHEPTQNSVLSYESHPYIFIVNDTDFAAQAVSESWDGDGSSETPFLIQGYEIKNIEELITIRNTTLHFKILDCNLTGAIYAVNLRNVTNGVIQNCLFGMSSYGVRMVNVTGIDVVGCSFSVPASWGNNGVYMDDAIDCSISSCVIQGATGTDAGIYGQYCEGIELFNNTIFEFANHGIFFGGSYDMNILNNTLYWNEGASGGGPTCGINIVESDLAKIYGNNITENMDNGITISDASNVTITHNIIIDNWIHGIYVEFSDYCIIQDNWIEGHGDGIIEAPACGISTYFADYIQISGNEFWWNALNSITLGYSNFAYISNNYLNHSFDHGIWVYISHNATVEQNEVYNSYNIGGGPSCGVLVEWSNDTSLIHNTFGHNVDNGITLLNSHDGDVIGNTIFDSEFCGIYAPIASGWNISHNVIYDNGAPGIFFDPSTMDNLIYYNDIGWSGEFLVGDNGVGNSWNYSGVGNWYSDYNGTGTYSITGTAGEVDHFPSRSLYCGVTDPSEYEVGTTGNTMTWNSSALNPESYELLIDSEPQGEVDWDGGAIAADVDGLPVGEYNITLVVFHVSGHWLSNQSTLTVVDTTGPTWSITPVTQHLEYGTPLSYQINATDPSGVDEYWLTGDTGFAIGSSGLITNTTLLVVDTYDITVHVNDTFGIVTVDDISIIVADTIDPVWGFTPIDQEILKNETFSYQLSATDLAGVSWAVNDTTQFTISGDGLITNATILAPGIYYLEITVTDGNSNSISITIAITVNDTVPPFDPTMVALAVGGLGVGVVIILLVYVFKKKQS